MSASTRRILRNGLLLTGALTLIGALLGAAFVLMSMAVVHD